MTAERLCRTEHQEAVPWETPLVRVDGAGPRNSAPAAPRPDGALSQTAAALMLVNFSKGLFTRLSPKVGKLPFRPRESAWVRALGPGTPPQD